MRSLLEPAAGLVCLVALACTGCSSGGGASDPSAGTGRKAAAAADPGAAKGSATSYAPYVSATTPAGTDSAGSPTTYNLAFVISDGRGCTPKWDGMYAIGDPAVKSRVAALAKSGAGVRVSFGGASGKELASACDSASALAAAYGAALDAAGSTRADFDVEGAQLSDAASVARRSEAIALLQKKRPGLTVSFTLPVMPSGLDSDALALLESADDHSVDVSTVDIMTMNYGSSYAGDMGDYAVASAEAAHTQLKKVFALSDADAWHGLALTSMIGVNDVREETFGLADAARVRAFAEKKGVAWVSMWSTFRDRPCEKGSSTAGDAATDCSGVRQSPGAFARALAG
ncbi:chitinase [Streptomyces sp. NPDC127038]|uniref:chitinase n=1 Tax=Streptomyces sp. NPDC127038 TaxID=3347114 RepID=UPI0036590073